ncbi:MAG: restriction endonuclease subunit S [Segetibacter sp.]
MNLNRETWQTVKIGQISEVQYGSSMKSTDSEHGYKTFRMNEIVNGFAIDGNNMKTTSVSADEFIKYKLTSGDILFNRTNSFEHVGRTGIFCLDGDYMFASHLLRLKLDKTKADPCYVNAIMNSPWFQTNIKKYATKAVGQANINANSLSNFKIPLPTVEEQKQIAKLLQSEDTSILKVEEQEYHFRYLQKKLSNNISNEEPVFGSLLNEANCINTNFSKVVECIEKHDKKKDIFRRFIGLDNIEPDNFKISTWGNVEDGTTFTKTFLKGDILFGKRRAYLRKVGMAEFDGICSGDILVFRANSQKILPALLPFYVLSDPFINHAVNTSAGSLSPRTKWKDLSTFKLSIPDLKTQEKVLEVLTQLLDTIHALQEQKNTLKNLKLKLLNEILG